MVGCLPKFFNIVVVFLLHQLFSIAPAEKERRETLQYELNVSFPSSLRRGAVRET